MCIQVFKCNKLYLKIFNIDRERVLKLWGNFETPCTSQYTWSALLLDINCYKSRSGGLMTLMTVALENAELLLDCFSQIRNIVASLATRALGIPVRLEQAPAEW